MMTWLVQVGLSAAGLACCLLFVREAQRGGTLPGCGPRSGCDVVSRSRWARVGNIPVATLGLLFYSILFLATLARASDALEPFAHFGCATLAISAVGMALWFTGLQLLILRRVCKFCMVLHGIGVLFCVMIWLESTPPNVTEMALGFGCGAMVILLQLILPSKTHLVVLTPTLDAPSSGTTGIPFVPPSSTGNSVSLLGDSLHLNVDEWPRLGSHNASTVIAVLFDITCTDCRALYRLLEDAITSHPGELAVLTLPIPLDPACNPRVDKAPQESTHACEFARLFLSVWRTDPEAFEQFRRWVMAPPNPPGLQESRSKAYKLLGPRRSGLAMTDDSVEAHVRKAVTIYIASKSELLPQLMLTDRLVVGRIGSRHELLTEIGKAQPHAGSKVETKGQKAPFLS